MKGSTKKDDEASRLLDKVGKVNGVRAVLMDVGGVVGLIGALM